MASLVSSTGDEYEITKRVAGRLSALLASGYRLPPQFTQPPDEHHVTYPLYIAPGDSWSLAAVVWNAGQRTPAGEHVRERGHVTVCRTTDDDVHAAAAVGNAPTVGIHVYGDNIGTLSRRSYDPATGAVRWFVSGWNSPAADGGQPQASSDR